MDREQLLAAVLAANWNATAAARANGIHPNTFQHWLKVRGIKRPAMPKREERHPPVALLVAELGRLRRHSSLLRTNYLPTPARAAMLRENELAQRAVLAKVRGVLGDQPVLGGVRGSPAPGAVRPAWGLRF